MIETTTDTKTDTKKQRTRRSPSGDTTKKIVSLTIDPALVRQIDSYAAERGISRSSAIEAAIMGLLALKPGNPIIAADNSLVLPDNCLFATTSVGAAIHY
jgi:hypothetical protein